MTKAEKHYKIAEMAVLGCHKSPKAITSEECAICQFNGDKCNQWQHAERLLNKGYQQIEWHKVVESDLPQRAGCYLCYCHILSYDRHNKLIDGYGYSVEFFDTSFCTLNKSVIAWTELPRYEG